MSRDTRRSSRPIRLKTPISQGKNRNIIGYNMPVYDLLYTWDNSHIRPNY